MPYNWYLLTHKWSWYRVSRGFIATLLRPLPMLLLQGAKVGRSRDYKHVRTLHPRPFLLLRRVFTSPGFSDYGFFVSPSFSFSVCSFSLSRFTYLSPSVKRSRCAARSILALSYRIIHPPFPRPPTTPTRCKLSHALMFRWERPREEENLFYPCSANEVHFAREDASFSRPDAEG